MTLGALIAHVEGKDIEIAAQAFNPNSNTWVNSLMQEAMSWDDASGLQLRLNVDDNPPFGDLDSTTWSFSALPRMMNSPRRLRVHGQT